MIKIVYGIQSFGLGHYSRSKATIDYLLSKGFQVKIFASGLVYDYLLRDNYDVHKISRIIFKFKNNHINYPVTILRFLFWDIPTGFVRGYLVAKRIVEKYKPDIVISDFEIYTSRVAYKLNIPLISIDNLHSLLLTDASDSVSSKYQKFKWNQTAGIKILTPRVDHFFILSFFHTNPVDKEKVTIIPPVLRNEIIKAKNTKIKDHFLVYMSIDTYEDMIMTLKKVPEQKFIVYGYNTDKVDGNLTYRRFSISDFISDLASSKGVISNGGFSFMSEAIFLGKPVFSVPIAGQFEMIMNCTFLEKLGYGMFADDISEKVLRDFISKNEYFKKNLKKIERNDNGHSFKLIEQKIIELVQNKK